jgi:hypothetical protein
MTKDLVNMELNVQASEDRTAPVRVQDVRSGALREMPCLFRLKGLVICRVDRHQVQETLPDWPTDDAFVVLHELSSTPIATFPVLPEAELAVQLLVGMTDVVWTAPISTIEARIRSNPHTRTVVQTIQRRQFILATSLATSDAPKPGERV